MAARFGRNKRRAAREAIAAAQKALEIETLSKNTWKAMLRQTIQERDLAQRRLAEIGNRIMVATSTGSGLLPLAMLETQRWQPYEVKWPIHGSMGDFARVTDAGDFPLGSEIVTDQEYVFLQHLVLFVEKYRDQFKAIVRFNNQSDGHYGSTGVNVAYAVTKETLRRIGFHNDWREFAAHIAVELANYASTGR